VQACIDLLIKTNRAPEATLFARSYAPSAASSAVKSWKTHLTQSGKLKLADTLADPEHDASAFDEGWPEALEQERRSHSDASDVAAQPNGHADHPETSRETDRSEVAEDSTLADTVGDLVENIKEMVIEPSVAETNGPDTQAGEYFAVCHTDVPAALLRLLDYQMNRSLQ
jgi:hypothetical protein